MAGCEPLKANKAKRTQSWGWTKKPVVDTSYVDKLARLQGIGQKADIAVCMAEGLTKPRWEFVRTCRCGRGLWYLYCTDTKERMVRVSAPQGCSGYRPDLCEE